MCGQTIVTKAMSWLHHFVKVLPPSHLWQGASSHLMQKQQAWMQMTRTALSSPPPTCTQPASFPCRQHGAQSPPLDSRQRHPALGLGSQGVTKPRRSGGSRQARADASAWEKRAASPAAGAAAVPQPQQPALSTEHSVAGSRPPWQGAALDRVLQPSFKVGQAGCCVLKGCAAVCMVSSALQSWLLSSARLPQDTLTGKGWQLSSHLLLA